MIYFDVTKTGSASHQSGLTRVSRRLREELGEAAVPVAWDSRRGGLVRSGATSGPLVALRPDDWFYTVELFDAKERPEFEGFVATRRCRLGAMFHDAIPLRFPQITWPQSVQRHAGYLKLLAGFDHVTAVSDFSRGDLLGFWRWQEVDVRARVSVIGLGADFDGEDRATGSAAHPGRPSILCVGIVEPRKNQSFLLEVCEDLWRQGVDFDLHMVGRVNPHFGRPIAERLRRAAKHSPRLRFHEAASDAELRRLYASATAVAFPTLAEGCGLPLLESLWRGVPCVASDLPVLRENADGGGCLLVPVNDAGAWANALRGVVTDRAMSTRLADEAVRRSLPRWSDTARQLATLLT